jgi:hypothetical protein
LESVELNVLFSMCHRWSLPQCVDGFLIQRHMAG